MKITICHISDTHGKEREVKFRWDLLKNTDIIIHSGDISSLGGREEVEEFLKWFTLLPVMNKIFIAGNHDKSFDIKYGNGKKPEWLEKALLEFTKNDNYFYLEDSGCECMGLKVWGTPWTPWFGGNFWAFNKHRGDDMNLIWDKIPKGTDILINHGPPQGILDYIPSKKERVGCETMVSYIKDKGIKLVLFGHIHDSNGYIEVGTISYSNGSLLNDDYQYAYSPRFIEIDTDTNNIAVIG
jgi:Icc-related predicted phosphoesterase